MCYNYEVVKTYGFFRTLNKLLIRRGLGAVLLFGVILAVILPTYALRITVDGATDYTSDAVVGVLEGYGVRRGARINKLDTAAVERSLVELDGVAFATVIRRGSRLKVTLVEELPKEDLYYLDEQVQVLAVVDAVITRQIVLSGTAVKSRGDVVRAGETVIAGYVLVGEEQVPTAARGEVYGLVYYTGTAVYSSLDGQPPSAEAEKSLSDEATLRAHEQLPTSARVNECRVTLKNYDGLYVAEAVLEVEQRVDDGILKE